MSSRCTGIAALAIIAATATGCATSAGGAVSGSAQATATPTFVPHGAVPSVQIATPRITLTDTTGAAYDLRSHTRDKVALVYFGYTHCADTCPTTMADIATALRKLDPVARHRVEVVFITTDPKRDTRPVLRKWLDKFDPRFVGLTGSESQITVALRTIGLPPATTTTPTPSPSAHALGAASVRLVAWSAPQHGDDETPGSYDVDHFAGVLAFDRTGTLVALYPEGFAVGDLTTDLQVLTKGS